MLSALVLLTALATAAEPSSTPASDAGSARVYGTARASVAVPTGYVGLAQSYSVEAGALFTDHNQVGIRLAYVPYPPDVYGSDTPNQAAGPVLTWAYQFPVSPRVDITPALAVGAVFGPGAESQENKVLPYLQAGLGLRAKIPTAGGGAVALGPEVGFVPTLIAPYVAANVTVIGRAPQPSSYTGP